MLNLSLFNRFITHKSIYYLVFVKIQWTQDAWIRLKDVYPHQQWIWIHAREHPPNFPPFSPSFPLFLKRNACKHYPSFFTIILFAKSVLSSPFCTFSCDYRFWLKNIFSFLFTDILDWIVRDVSSDRSNALAPWLEYQGLVV